jgi:5-methylcytosine-specific restriction endonuclease McrA
LYPLAEPVKIPVYYCYPYEHLQKTEFNIRFDGIEYIFHCKKLNDFRKRIRKARALLIRGTVITAQPSQYWQFDKKKSQWTYHAHNRPAPIQSGEVYWALSNNRNLIETYQQRRVARWKIIQTIRQCYLCDSPYEKKSKPYWYDYCGRFRNNIWAAVCGGCRKNLESHKKNAPKKWSLRWEYKWGNLTTRDNIETIASQDRSWNIRWLRRFAAEGNFTFSEFKALCKKHGNICLRCKKKRILVADHVIPLARGGRNDIANIQPLCKKCNGIKSDKSIDYRKKSQKE